MSALELVITLRSPALLAAAPPASNLIETLRFLPGNTLRGVLARRALDLGLEPESAEFARLFLSGEVAFGTAYLGGALPLPLSARSCKYEPGFQGAGGHGVVDLLLAEGSRSCPVANCGRSLDYFTGFWRPDPGRKVTVGTRLLTRTAIDPARGTASAGQLFSQEVLSEGEVFHGRLEGPEELVARLAELVKERFIPFLGGGSSRGQGWAEITARPAPAETGRGEARERYRRYRERAGRSLLAVTLSSEGLFQDDYLRDATLPSLRDLAALGLSPDDWQPEPFRAFLDVRTVFGFDGEPIRLPRPPRLAVAAGSTFLYAARAGREPAIPGGNGEGWIGEGRREGYGRAVLWHPFHLDPETAT